MGKKNIKAGVGQGILRARSKGSRVTRQGESWRHTSELNDAVDWKRLNISSITEQSALDDFLATAELAGTEFTAEKLNVTVVTPSRNEGILSAEQAMHIHQAQEDNKNLLRIPRRPSWTTTMTAQELDLKERDSFVEWRRQLADLQEEELIILTPFEKNIEFWRQLWRVIERSDVIVQIVDARNPLLFRCEDLVEYVKEVNPLKDNLLLINKADYLTSTQRSMWARYFQDKGITVAFWSALNETERMENEGKSQSEESERTAQEDLKDTNGTDEDDQSEEEQCGIDSSDISVTSRFAELSTEEKETKEFKENLQPKDTEILRSEKRQTENDEDDIEPTRNCAPNIDSNTATDTLRTNDSEESHDNSTKNEIENIEKSLSDNNTKLGCKPDFLDCSGELLGSEELIEFCRALHHRSTSSEGGEDQVTTIGGGEDQVTAIGGGEDQVTTIGMVGYPNVGKSSTINAILQHKKVPVSATPGRTKHFQTLHLGKNVCLCDCPGLVFPSFVSTKAEMVVNGILPIDQMRDHLPPVALVCQRIPREVLEAVYGINIPSPSEGDEPNRPPFADELLNAYGYMRGYMTSSGTPDCPRSARYVLKDYVKGKLLYCTPPPGVNGVEFQDGRYATGRFADLEEALEKRRHEAEKQMGARPKVSSIDAEFFAKKEVRQFVKGTPVTVPGQEGVAPTAEQTYKPWKKHNNKNKREKLRRLENKSH